MRHGFLTPTEAGVARGRYGGLSADLLRRLPLFEQASLSDVLAIRRELEGPLRGFRLAISGFSREIRSAAWEPGFPEEANALFREKVVQEVERIEETVKENGSLRELAWRTVHHGATPATFGALVGSASDLPALAGAAAGGLPILAAAGAKPCWTAGRSSERLGTTSFTSITGLARGSEPASGEVISRIIPTTRGALSRSQFSSPVVLVTGNLDNLSNCSR